MRIYQLLTGNSGTVDALNQHPIRGQGWELQADLDEAGHVDDTHARMISPDGEILGTVDLARRAARSQMVELIHQDHEAYESAPTLEEEVAPILICVRRMPTGTALATLWLSGEEGVSAQGPADDARTIRRGPNAIDELGAVVDEWKRQHPGARVDSEIPLADLVRAEEGAAAGAEPAKSAPPQAAEAARAARQVGQALQTASKPAEQILRLPLGALGHFPGGNQRTTFVQEKLDELAASIRAVGDVLEPLLVIRKGDHYELVAGERRLRAAKMAGLPDVPCRVIEADEAKALAVMAVENLLREDLSPIDEARAYQRLERVLGSQGDVADMIGKSRVHVNEFLQLLDPKMPAATKQQLAEGTISVKAALAVLRQTRDLPEQKREKVGRAVADERPSTREAPKAIDRALAKEGVARATPAERARVLAEIGRAIWAKRLTNSHTGPNGEPETCLFDRECYLPLERVLKHWQVRQDLGATGLPKSMGGPWIDLPEAKSWFCAPDDSSYGGGCTVELSGSRLVITAGKNGAVEALHTGNPVYFRAHLTKAGAGGHKSLKQQLVIQDGGRFIVVTGAGTAMIRADLVPKLEQLVGDLPALPEW